jgi:hypothetical protein
MGGGYSRRDAQTRQSVLVLIGVHHIHPQSPLISFHFISFQFNLAGTFGLCPACFLWPCSAISAIGPCRGLPIGARHDSTMVRTMPWLVRRGVELEGNDWRQPRSSGTRILAPAAMAWRGDLFAGICPRIGASAESYAEREGHWAD